MNTQKVDGQWLRQGVIAGARRVIMMQENLNRINVFPVPDNDTGTNMALTLQSVAEGAISCQDLSIAGMSQCLADSALMGARGNSGAILAQFFQGLAESFEGKLSATSQHFAEAAQKARTYAFEAIAEPREGTILTVIHAWAEKIKSQCYKSHDFLELLKEGLREAQRSLKETPKKLKLLARAGVVDAGAQGFVHMLEGIIHFMESGKIERAVGIGEQKQVARAKVEEAPEDIAFQFCTECLIEGEAIARQELKEKLE
ncbi:MAG: DAK2 domain-containing protein, partial [bacterium]